MMLDISWSHLHTWVETGGGKRDGGLLSYYKEPNVLCSKICPQESQAPKISGKLQQGRLALSRGGSGWGTVKLSGHACAVGIGWCHCEAAHGCLKDHGLGCMKQMFLLPSRREKRMSQGTTDQPASHRSLGRDGANNPGKNFQTYSGQEGGRGRSVWIY